MLYYICEGDRRIGSHNHSIPVPASTTMTTIQRVNPLAVLCLFVGVFVTLSPTVAALRCYRCQSATSWSDCESRAVTITCDTTSPFSVMGHELFLAPGARQGVEPACVGVYAVGTVNGVKGYAHVRDCFINDKSMCSVLQDTLPSEIKIKDCDLCTTDLCNGANRYTVGLSSLLLLAFAVLLWK
ncbi:hypothetical protein AND_006177 [Anopheles darlingi]|uniref:Protein sleepless n=1 Tax=Anopheles darlingi TaxID=43151 RepID=W5JFM0_ANODA|nr:hypothetical protein AND_006177 [Anopheles darlingi]